MASIGEQFLESMMRLKQSTNIFLKNIFNRQVRKTPKVLNINKWRFSEEKLNSYLDYTDSITKNAQEFYETGYENGKVGIDPSSIDKIAESRAKMWRSNIEVHCLKKLEFAKYQYSLLETSLDKFNVKEDSLLVHESAIEEHYKHNFKKYNIALGRIYIMIAIILIAADFPLAKTMAEQGFELPFVEKELFAIGLVLMTVIIKIMYDRYLGLTVKEILVNKRPDIIMGKGFEASPEEESKSDKVETRQFLVMMLILLFVFITIIVAGIYRIEVSDNTNLSPIGKLVFILITCSFPLISGIAASVGIFYIKNAKLRKEIKSLLKAVRSEKESIIQRLGIEKGNLSTSTSLLDLVGVSGSFLNDCTKYFKASYNQGYNQSRLELIPDDFYDLAKMTKQRNYAQKSSSLYFK